nr:NB-ARC domains-containing protein [Tanacetum cinerariifolium]
MAASSKPDQWTYDVFVSFRGEDIRQSFMDHLFKDFNQKGIHAFRDNELPKGEVISPELYKAIEKSRFLIVIFSRNYASSSWCLKELVKILECKEMEEPKYEVRIIFYDVKPDVVRKQTESYAKAFQKHVVLNKLEVTKWKEALSKAANLSGWDLQDLTNGYEAKFIDIISREILSKLRDGPLHVGEKLVGVDAHLKKLNLHRFVGSNKVHMYGICGISGIGKTTLAKAIYNSMHTYFEGSCFCDDVQGVTKRQDITQVQMQLIDNIMKIRDVKIWTRGEGSVIIKQRVTCKPILLVLDNVNHHEQVEALAGSPDWFSPGSLIIFTSKDRQLLRSHDVEIYDMPILPYHEAYELFCLHAFGQKHPTEDFKELVYQVLEHLQGHPLALKVFGGCLYEKPANVWKRKLDRLKIYLNADIKEKLYPCLDGLDFDQKRTFLDIACSFVGENKDFAVNVLDDNDCFAEDNINFLVDKSLITISPHGMSIQMHELIQSMAREIVREESNVPGNRSRLWGQSEEVYRALSENKASEDVEVINIWKEKSSQKFDINGSAFSRMKKLRILKLPRNPNVYYSGKLGYLSNNLRYLCWHGCPFKFLPSDFYPENIVVIDLSYSYFKNLWTTPKCFTKLKILKLSHCHNLTNTPDFTHITNLNELILEGCVSLVKVHPSIGMLKSLIVLNMKNCKRVKSFPCKLEMDSLQVLNLSGCLRVDHLPEALGQMKRLLELHIDRTAITRLPFFVFSLTNLLVSSFGQHERFWSRWWTTISQPLCLPQSLLLSSLASLPLLQSLNLSWCNILRVPEDIGGLSYLKELELTGNSFTSLPESLSRLSHLHTLVIDGCKKLEVFPELPPSIKSLVANDCNILQVPETIGRLSCLEELVLDGNNFTSLPGSLSELSHLKLLLLNACNKLEVLPELPPSILDLYAFLSPKLFEHLMFGGPKPQPFDTCITANGSRDKLISSLLQYVDIQNNIFELFNQESPSLEDKIDMTFHGNRIPEWFSNQSMGSRVKVEIPPDWCYNKFRGYAICVVFTPRKLFGFVRLSVNNFDGACLYDSSTPCYISHHDESDMILLHYVTRNRRWELAKDFVTFSISRDEDFEVKMCGVRLVCDEDMDSSMIDQLPTPTQDGGTFTQTGRPKNIQIRW